MDGRSILKKFEIDCNLIKDIDDYEMLEIKPGIKVENDQFYKLKLIKIKNVIDKEYLPEVKNRETLEIMLKKGEISYIYNRFNGRTSDFPEESFKNKFIKQHFIQGIPILDETVEKLKKCKNNMEEIDDFLENEVKGLYNYDYERKLKFVREAMALAGYKDAYEYINAKYIALKMEEQN